MIKRQRTRVLISPWPEQEGNKLQRQNILIFIYAIYDHNWGNIYIYINKTSIKRNILTIKIHRELGRAYQHPGTKLFRVGDLASWICALLL